MKLVSIVGIISFLVEKKGKRDTTSVWVWQWGGIGMKFHNVHNLSFFYPYVVMFSN